MSEAKPQLVWIAEYDEDSDYLSVVERLDTQGEYEGLTICRLHGEAYADLIADAGTVYHTTGLTPSQLVERVKELEGVLQQMVDFFQPYAGGSSENRKDALSDAIAVLAKSTSIGDTPCKTTN